MKLVNYQEQFFQLLRHRFKDQKSMAESISEVVDIGIDSAYRRISGKSQLRVNEFIQLSKHFRLSFPEDDAGVIRFRFNNRQQEIRSPEDYIDQLEQRMALVESWPDKRLYYATPDLPFFYELMSPTLLAFKLYVFGVTSWGFDHWKSQPFRLEMIDQRVLEKAAKISHYAYRVPSKELWSSGILTATLSQVEYMVMIGKFADPAVPERILDEIGSVVEHLEQMAIFGKKFIPGEEPEKSKTPYALHYNELLYVSTTICVHSPNASLVFLSFLTPNFLVTTDQSLGEEVQSWFETLLQDATKLSNDTRLHREWFFNRLRAQIAGARGRIKQQLLDQNSPF